MANSPSENQQDQASAPEAACGKGPKKTTIGGQALIEGLMMIGPDRKAMAVRKADGTILLEQLPVSRFKGAANVIFLRGSMRLFQQLVSGTKALLRSADLVELRSEERRVGKECR